MNTTTQILYKLLENKNEEEKQEFLRQLLTGEAIALQTIILSILTQEDFQAIDKIIDDEEAEREIISRFKAKTTLTPNEFIRKLHHEIVTPTH